MNKPEKFTGMLPKESLDDMEPTVHRILLTMLPYRPIRDPLGLITDPIELAQAKVLKRIIDEEF